tara:strand:+ start:2798 stop:3043 length:246 start_codon:yes stop_codon:yes gene_type:complete
MRDSISDKLRVMGSRAKLALFVLAFALLVLEVFVHRHAETDIETLFFFPAFYAFVICVAIVLGGIVLRKLVMRNEDYYDNG